MTVPPVSTSGSALPSMRPPLLTAPVNTGVPPIVGDEAVRRLIDASARRDSALSDDAPILLGPRLDGGNTLPDATQLALALEAATRALQTGRAEQVLTALDAVWSAQLTADSPWYLRTAALQLMNRTSDAEHVLRDAITLLPRSAALLYLLGVHTSLRGHPDAARLANDHALALHPNEPLLWLQRAALALQSGTADDAAAILQRVQRMEPTYPAEQWLDTLVRLAAASTRSPTPGVQRAIARLTPSSIAVISSENTKSPPVAIAATPLATAVRYGLTLLESPTHSARLATPLHTTVDPGIHYAAMQTRTDAPLPLQRELPVWESLLLAAGVAVIAVMPALRIPALMLCGALTMLIISRRLR